MSLHRKVYESHLSKELLHLQSPCWLPTRLASRTLKNVKACKNPNAPFPSVWSYDPRVESDPLGQDAARDRVHSSMYASLRTNLPREVMGYLDFPFDATRRWSSDARRFCGHAEVQRYLEAYAAHHRIQVELNHSVERVSRRDGGAGGGWEAVVRGPGGESVSRRFDAVMVCNGHYSEPKVPPVRRPGGDERPFPGAEVHSHNYRDSRGYEGKSVVVVGAMSSGEDISREIAEVASTVYLSANSWQNPQWGTPEARREPMGQKGNIWRRPMVSALHSDGTVSRGDPAVLRTCMNPSIVLRSVH